MASQTIKLSDLAKELGLSVSTVSKALNDSREISQETKKRVLTLSKKLNYRPNSVAQSLKQSRTKTIGVIIPDLLNYYFVKALNGIQQASEDQGYSIITCVTNESMIAEKGYFDLLTNGSVDGLIVAMSIETQKKQQFDHFNQLINNEFPLVLFDRVSDQINCSQIVSDDFESGLIAARHLFEENCQCPAVIIVNSDLEVIKRREEGFIHEWKTLKKNNPLKQYEIFDLDHCEDLITQFLLDHPSVDAVFAVDERLGIKSLKCALNLGKPVPKGFKVIGVSNGELSKEFSIPLSVIDLRENEIGMAAAAEVFKIVKSYNAHQKINVIPPKLLVRSSSY